MTFSSVVFLILLAAQVAPPPRLDEAPPEKSPYLAFIDRDYMFTIEAVKAGVLLLNFVSMTDTERPLYAKEIRLTLETRKVPGRFFVVDTGDPKQPITTPLLKMRPRSSFGARLTGDFGEERELSGAAVTIGSEDLRLVPVTAFQFENLAIKINRINLNSPDFTEDWAVLKFERIGSRARIRKQF